MLRRLAVPLVALGLLVAAAGGSGASATGPGPETVGPVVGPVVGAAGIGDPYFPEDGNGGIDVLTYAVHDRYLFTGRLAGWTRVRLRTTEALSAFDLDFLLPVSRVRLSTGPATFDRPDSHELQVRPARPLSRGETLTVTVWYAGRPARRSYAGESTWLATAHEAEAVNEPHIAPWWFPSDDHPLDKARLDLHLTVPAGDQVVANGRLLGVRRSGARTTYHWGRGGPMATYLAFFVAGRLSVRRGTAHGLPYYLAVSRRLPRAERASAMRGLRETPGIVAWLSRRFGPYPFSTTGGVVTALDPGFALENQTRPVYPLGVSRVLMVHELAHQWFGDSVSVHHWADVWLNEGFATFVEHLWTADHGGESTARWLRQTYAGESGSFWDLPVADPGPAHLFDWPVYQRGAMTLAALRRRIGGPTFATLLRRWAALHRHRHGRTSSFEALASRLSGQDLSAFFDAWLVQPTKPAATADNGL